MFQPSNKTDRIKRQVHNKWLPSECKCSEHQLHAFAFNQCSFVYTALEVPWSIANSTCKIILKSSSIKTFLHYGKTTTNIHLLGWKIPANDHPMPIAMWTVVITAQTQLIQSWIVKWIDMILNRSDDRIHQSQDKETCLECGRRRWAVVLAWPLHVQPRLN